MRLYDNWRTILKRAWSIRLMALAVVLTGLETILPFFEKSAYAQALPGGVLPAVSCVVIIGALIARLAVQKGLPN